MKYKRVKCTYFPAAPRGGERASSVFTEQGTRPCCCCYFKNRGNKEWKAPLAKHHIPKNNQVEKNILLSHRKPPTYSRNRNETNKDNMSSKAEFSHQTLYTECNA